jgi:hypothetical protein
MALIKRQNARFLRGKLGKERHLPLGKFSEKVEENQELSFCFFIG